MLQIFKLLPPRFQVQLIGFNLFDHSSGLSRCIQSQIGLTGVTLPQQPQNLIPMIEIIFVIHGLALIQHLDLLP